MTLVSSGIRFVRIFMEVPREGASKDSVVIYLFVSTVYSPLLLYCRCVFTAHVSVVIQPLCRSLFCVNKMMMIK